MQGRGDCHQECLCRNVNQSGFDRQGSSGAQVWFVHVTDRGRENDHGRPASFCTPAGTVRASLGNSLLKTFAISATRHPFRTLGLHEGVRPDLVHYILRVVSGYSATWLPPVFTKLTSRRWTTAPDWWARSTARRRRSATKFSLQRHTLSRTPMEKVIACFV